MLTPKRNGVKMIGQILSLFAFAFLMACASSTEEGTVGVGRKQLLLVPSEQIIQMSYQGYDETKKTAASKGQLDQSPEHVRRVNAVMNRLTPLTSIFRKDAPAWEWEVHVLSSNDINAYCMPGGKIMFYTGILEKLQMTDGEIAAVMGHEIAHALREHGRERMSEQLISQVGLQVLAASGKVSPTNAQLIGAGLTYAVMLPHGRGQETEADEMGVELMARAGYDPREALSLWKKMAANGGAKPPEILSSHPADDKRLARIESLLPKVMPLYERAKK